MKSTDELKETNIKNCTCYDFDDLIKIEHFDFDNILIDEKSCKNILVYNISHKTLFDAKLLCIIINKVEGIIRVYDGTRYLVIFGPEKHNAICNRTRYIREVESGIIYVFCHNYARIKVDSYDSLALEKT